MPSYYAGAPVPPTTSQTVSPAAGIEAIFTVPAGQIWVPLAFTAVLTTSATAANRIPAIVIDDGTNTLFYADPAGTPAIPASTVALISAAAGIGSAAVQGPTGAVVNWLFPIPVGLTLGPGYRVKTSTTALQAGDAFTACRLAAQIYT